MKPCVTCGAEKEEGNNDSYCKPCRLERGRENRRKAALAAGRAIRTKNPKGRSPLCSSCKQPKEPGRENESRCKSCKSESLKVKREKARIEKGLRPFGSGRKPECCRCGELKENLDQGYCYECKNITERENRLIKSQSEEFKQKEREKVNSKYRNDVFFAKQKKARAAVASAIKKGLLIKQPCKVCGEERVDGHHEDYDKPLDVIWLCRLHHLEHHNSTD